LQLGPKDLGATELALSLFQRVWVQVMDEEPSSLLWSGIIREIAGGANEAFDELLRRYNTLLVQRASCFLRRLRMYETFYEGQEVVDDALAAMCDRARRGELLTVQSSGDFWREFFGQVRRAIRKIGDYVNAQKRSPKASATASHSHRRRDARCAEPEHRLVARNLERHWEEALTNQRAAEEALDRFRREQPVRLTGAERALIQELAATIPSLWNAPETRPSHRQLIVRQLIECVEVGVRDGTKRVEPTIRWAGGYESRHELRRPVSVRRPIRSIFA
jgi:hypothetical protein